MQITINSSMYINNISQWQRVKTGQSCANVCWSRGCDYLPFSIEHQPQWAAFTQHCAPNCSIDMFKLECCPSLMKVHIEFGQRHNSCSPPLLLSSSHLLLFFSPPLCSSWGSSEKREREKRAESREQREERSEKREERREKREERESTRLELAAGSQALSFSLPEISLSATGWSYR